jgi:flagellar motor switch/type III secretory pathway protein FliN
VDVVTRPQVRALLEEAVAAWSTAWFTSRQLTITGARAVSGALPTRPDRPVFGTTTGIGYSARAVARLLDWALDTRLDEVTITPADQQVLDGFERRMMEDLASRLEAAIGAAKADKDAAAASLGGLEATIGDGAAGDLVTFTLPLHVLLPAIRGSFRAPSRRASLQAIGGALAASPLVVDAVLGHADIRVSDLHGLAPGDVLVLQTPLDAGVELSLSGSPTSFGRGVLTEIDGCRAVALEQ